ncbi:MAG: hypothetical protein ACR65U_01635 [Methylocystis sp.]
MREKAAQYYAVAIAHSALSRHNDNAFLEDGISSIVNADFPAEFGDILTHRDIFDSALEILIDKYIFIKVIDDFAPTIFLKHDNALHNYSDWASTEEDGVARKFNALGSQKNTWLRSALIRINDTFSPELLVSSDEWQPIPIDRSTTEYQETEKRLDEALAAIRSDNGFADTFPDERNQVVSALETGLKIFRENSTVHVTYFKAFIIDPLAAAIRRLKDNAAGVAATVAKAATIKWLADSIGENLPDWLRELF